MGTYEELSTNYSKIVDENEELEKSIKNFVSELIKKLIEYFDIEPDKISFFKPNSYTKDSKPIDLLKAIELKSDNFWHFYFKIRIEHNKYKGKERSYVYYFAVKPKENNTFIFEVFTRKDATGKEFLIDLSKEEDISNVCDYIYNGLEKAINNLKYPFEN